MMDGPSGRGQHAAHSAHMPTPTNNMRLFQKGFQNPRLPPEHNPPYSSRLTLSHHKNGRKLPFLWAILLLNFGYKNSVHTYKKCRRRVYTYYNILLFHGAPFILNPIRCLTTLNVRLNLRCPATLNAGLKKRRLTALNVRLKEWKRVA